MAVASLNLEVVEGPDAGLQVPLRESLVIGREVGSGVRLHDARVSRHHARVTPSAGEVVIEDLGSANGTFVNRNEVHAPTRVLPGDEVLLGTSVLEVQTAEQVRAGRSGVRPVPPALAAPERNPDYVAAREAQPAPAPGPPDLTRLIDVRVKAQARLAPLAVFLLAAFALIAYYASR